MKNKRSKGYNSHIIEAWQDARVRVLVHRRTNAKLAQSSRAVAGSVCANCYAYERGRYRFQNVKDAQYKRFAALKHPLWAEAWRYKLILKRLSGRVRRHDSGDVQNLDHLNKIYEVCRLSPDVKHWMPTRMKRG